MEQTDASAGSGNDATDAPAPEAPAAGGKIEAGQASSATEAIKDGVLEVLKTIYDPEIPVNIYELGLIYTVDVSEEGNVSIEMTLTSPMCPVAGSLPPEVELKASTADGVKACIVELVWEPPWNPDMMSEAAKLELNMW